MHYICDQAGLGTRLTFRKMFGEYALYLDGKVVALVCDDQLFLKPTEEARQALGQVTLAPPYPGAREHFLLGSELDDPEVLHNALQVTGDALPARTPKPQPRPKPGRKAKARTKTQAEAKTKTRTKAKATAKGKAKGRRRDGGKANPSTSR